LDAALRSRVEERVDALPPGLRDHIHRVVEIAQELAVRHDLAPELAALGALAHDVARAMPGSELLRRAAELGLPVGLVERRVPVLLHGPVGAELLRREDGLQNSALYQAVYWHTSGHPGLDKLGRVVFLADKLDPQKIGRYPYLPLLQQLAFQDLDQAMLEFTTREITSLVAQGEMVHPAMVDTRNSLLAGHANNKPLEAERASNSQR